MDIVVHPRVQKYIEKSGEKERFVQSLKLLSADPYNSRSGVDIKNAVQSEPIPLIFHLSQEMKKLKGKRHDMYRLRVGPHRFEYIVEDEKIWVDDAFYRERGYR